MELLATLGIDWKLLVAQLLNFGILMVVLSYFVYRPVLRLLDERRERVRKSMADAKAIEQQRREAEQFKAEQLRRIDQETGQFLEKAKQQAEEARREILKRAEEEAGQILEKAKAQLQQDREKLLSEMQESLGRVAVKLASSVLEREFAPADQERLLRSLERSIPHLLR